jgi:MFS family permease
MIGFMWLTLQLSGGKGIALGGVLSIYTLGAIIFGFIAGPIVDRVNKKNVLIFIDILRGVIVFLLYWLVKLQMATVLHIYIVTFGFSILSPFFHRAEFAIIPQLVEKNQILSANGLLNGSKRLMQIISPALGGVFIGIFGIAICFFYDAISFFFSAICILFITITPIEVEKKSLGFKLFTSDVKEGYKFLIDSTFLLTLAIYAACINFFGSPIFPLIPLISQRVSAGATGYGAMMSGMSIGLIVSSLFVGIVGKFLSKISVVLVGLLISALAIIIMAMGMGIIPLVIASVLLGFGLNFSNLPIMTLFQEKVPGDRIGVVSSFVFTIAQIAMPISIALSGLLVDIFSLKFILIAIAIILIIGALIGFRIQQFKQEES